MWNHVKTYQLSASGSVVGTGETLRVKYEHFYLFTECHIVVGHRHQPRDTWEVNFHIQYGERHITLDFKRRHQTSCSEENLSSIQYYLQILSIQFLNQKSQLKTNLTRRHSWECISPTSEFLQMPLSKKSGHVRTVPGNMLVNFEVRSPNHFGVISI